MNSIKCQLRRKALTRLLGAVLAVGLPLGSSAFADLPRSYEDASTRVRAAQYSLDRDKTDLASAQRRVDDIIAARDRQLRELPSPELRPVADASQLREQLKATQASIETAKAKIDQQHAEALKQFESTDAFKAAYARFDEARKELKKPTDAVLDQLAMSREFQEAVTAARAAKSEEKRLRDAKPADPKAITAAEAAFITADNKVQDLEEKALTADPAIVSLRQKVDAAQDDLKKMRDQMEQDFASAPANASMLNDLRQKQTALDTLNADLKRLDAQVAQVADRIDRPAGDADVSRDARAQLEKINSDLDNAKQDVSKLEARVREDQDGLNYALQDREAYDRAAAEAPPVVVERPVYVDEPVVIERPVYVDSAPVYDYPYSGSSLYFSFGGYSTYRDRCDYYGYRRSYDDDDRGWRSHDWNRADRDYRSYYGSDYSYGGSYESSSRARANRLQQQQAADHLAYRKDKDQRDTQQYLDSQQSLHARRASEDAQRQSRMDYDNRRQVRENEALHAHRAIEDADRAAARQRESNNSSRSTPAIPRSNSSAPSPRQSEPPVYHHQDAAPAPAPRHQDSPAPRSHEVAVSPSHGSPDVTTSRQPVDSGPGNSSDGVSHGRSRSR